MAGLFVLKWSITTPERLQTQWCFKDSAVPQPLPDPGPTITQHLPSLPSIDEIFYLSSVLSPELFPVRTILPNVLCSFSSLSSSRESTTLMFPVSMSPGRQWIFFIVSAWFLLFWVFAVRPQDNSSAPETSTPPLSSTYWPRKGSSVSNPPPSVAAGHNSEKLWLLHFHQI